ncbi:MAG: hypothetical protein AAGA29_02035 [Planctomycetota bacterium]
MSGIGPIIILVIVVGGWIIKAVTAINESKAKNEKRRQRPDYDELAARRMAELQQQAQQQRVDTTQVGQRDLSSLSMAERIEIARQRAAQQQGGRPDIDLQSQALRQQQMQQERLRQQQLQQQQQRQQQQRQQQARRQQQQSQARQPQPAQSLRQQRAQKAAAKQSLSQIKQREARKHSESHERVHKTARRDKAVRRQEKMHAPASRAKRRNSLIDFSKLSHRSLRQAIVLKEILDKPVALRD